MWMPSVRTALLYAMSVGGRRCLWDGLRLQGHRRGSWWLTGAAAEAQRVRAARLSRPDPGAQSWRAAGEV